MSDAAAALDAFCQAIRANDDAAVQRQHFVTHNWPLITTIDRLADAELAAGQYAAAAAKFRLIESLVPHATGFFLRRISAALLAGDPGALDELAASGPRLTHDNELFHAFEELTGNGRPDLAAQVIDACRARPGFSPGIFAAGEARILSASGHCAQAIAVLTTACEPGPPPIQVLRLCYLIMEQVLDFPGAQRVSAQAALEWGEERELRHSIDRLLFIFDFDGADDLLRAFAQRHPARLDLAARLSQQADTARATAAAALAACGPAAGASQADIYAALSKPGTPPERVLWGKQALVALLYGGAMQEADYARFAWFLPNWEEGLIRNHVLAAARARFPDAASVQAGWLHHLITQNIYGDAARFCTTLLRGNAGEDSLFYVIGLLRLQVDGMVRAFMAPAQLDSLRTDLLRRMPATSAGFRCVMHGHIAALGGDPGGWPADAVPMPPAPDALGLRRLFAVTTGRLSRQGTQSPPPRTAPIRPVLALSGQLRGFETTWPSIETHLRRPTGAPVIMSIWDTSINATGRHARRLERALPDDIVARLRPEERYTDAFEAAYPETFKLLFGQTPVDVRAIRAMIDQAGAPVIDVETESEALIAQLLPPHVSPNMLKMYYKFARLESLIRDAEARSGALFSHVIWSRPDCGIQRLSPADLQACLSKPEVAWSSFITENSFGDYVMILPRRAFAAIAAIFPRVVTGGDTRLLPWRPNRSVDPARPSTLDGFGGPDVVFDVLLGAGYMPLGRIPRMALRLVGRTPGADVVRQVFEAERAIT